MSLRFEPFGSCARWRDGSLRHGALAPASVFTADGSELALLSAFRKPRRHDSGGRVRITANGQLITSRLANGAWTARYVGRVALASLLGNWEDWVTEARG